MADDFDLRAHMGTYAGFTKLLTIGLVGAVIVLALLGIFVA